MVAKELLHFKVTGRIAKGGMGEVYATKDSKLHRKVAFKVLLPEVAGDHERRAGFEREAQVVAALNHPNIVTVFSVEEAGSAPTPRRSGTRRELVRLNHPAAFC